MKKITIPITVLVLFCLLLISCSRALTNIRPFSSYVDQPIKLVNKAYLVPLEYSMDRDIWMGVRSYKEGEMFELISQRTYDWSTLNQKNVVYVLLPGTPLNFKQVMRREGDGTSNIIAIGSVYVEELKQFVPIEYQWDKANHETILRAPWEDDTVPEKRNF